MPDRAAFYTANLKFKSGELERRIVRAPSGEP
jgi:hypothetical protein